MRPFRNPALCLLPLSSILLPTNAAVISSSTGSLANPSVNASSSIDSTNIASLGAIDPAKFKIRTHYGEIPLSASSVLMNIVDAMVQLALQDWNSNMGRKSFKLDVPKHLNIEIYISPWDEAADAKLRSAFAVLGLFEVFLHILSDPSRRFKSTQSTFFYDGSKLGWLMIKHFDRPRSISASNNTKDIPLTFPTFAEATQSLDKIESLGAMATATALEAPAWDDSHLKVKYVQGLDTLTIYEAFFITTAWIKEMAVHDRNARVIEFRATINMPPITVARQPIEIAFRDRNKPPRTAGNPPYFQWEWLIKAFGRMPQHMVDAMDFRSVLQMTLTVDNVPVGEGYVVRYHPDLQVVGGTGGNVTTA